MRFRLIYRGPLSTSKDIKVRQKHDVRRQLHPQLRELWERPPLNERPELVDALKRSVGKNFTFVPLVNRHLALVAEVDITLLRAAPPGGIVVGPDGDIDNQLKVLFDALTVPRPEQVPPGEVPADGETPFYCLLEDDGLITDVAVTTDRLLAPKEIEEVVVVVAVQVRTTRRSIANIDLGV